ncbi:MAG: ParB/RepB/Spo0J family partition protein [Elusimicrobia bacterium]|nr:ParB/RepB/Spo0J family partition protein [Elusimicrobiota bacterium]
MRKALGRGLDALISSAPEKSAENGEVILSANNVTAVPLEKIRPNHLQPRKYFDPVKLSELSASIKEHGLAQPILVSYDSAADSYELIAGERRLRAAELAGLKEIEVVVRAPESDKKRLALALIENLQREDLNPIEEALGYLRLMKEFGITQTELGEVMGKAKSTISNTLRILDLPEEMQKAIQFGQLTEGHAKALLTIEDPLERKKIFEMAVSQKLSVREIEDLARQSSRGKNLKASQQRPSTDKSADLKALESALQHFLGTKVEIQTRKNVNQGRITIHFYSLEEFDKIVKVLKK